MESLTCFQAISLAPFFPDGGRTSRCPFYAGLALTKGSFHQREEVHLLRSGGTPGKIAANDYTGALAVPLILRISSIAQGCRCCRAHRAPSAADRVGSQMETRSVYFSDIGCAIRLSKFIFLSRRTDLKPPLPTAFLCLFTAGERCCRRSAANVLTFVRAN